MLYAMLVCGAFVLFYTLFRCFKRYKKVQMEKTAMEINERYFKYGVENQKNPNLILPTFGPNPNPEQSNQFYSYPKEMMN